ncbi:pimeloyl-ACP methyl ester carboxylesterase [Mycolicibacterium iranicum]|uniref:Pimeloyl-ACP methyl ester carboxylesterase n=1 Tax=Mycolicibacterium iranicum TaxID=912594 RepID=A0A839PZF2_MYCIR|nr:alpha/beta fold hydrolase [Mycolicibacterium iranicum]MBB2988829.1 pimeloyl-ACP methyl ester carboxylesterase [Mycolicibacterium iranicum]
MAHLLIPGAGGSAWYWHRVVPLLEQAGVEAVAVDLPADDEDADLLTYADIASVAAMDTDGPLTIVGQSMGALTAPIVAERLPTASLILLNPMVPAPGESPGNWWSNTGQEQAQVAHFREIGLGRTEFDFVEDFFHDVPADVRDEALRRPEPEQSEAPFAEPWPLPYWPDVPTRVLAGRDDRLFPLEFQRRVVRERLGLDIEVIPGGHLAALSRPDAVAAALLAAP